MSEQYVCVHGSKYISRHSICLVCGEDIEGVLAYLEANGYKEVCHEQREG